ncbi:MAG: MotA/TolQ/ExbB proton channel family protein [Bradymonadia bacterium]
MFTDVDKLIELGGAPLIIMIASSIMAVTLAFERLFTLWNFMSRARALVETVSRCLGRGAVAEARTACERSKSPLADVLLVGFERHGRTSAERVRAGVDRERQRLMLHLRGPLWLLGTIGATAPFVGLFGTVAGIIRAFEAIGESKQAGIEVVGPGIAEALVATAIGIAVAVIALVFFNYFQSRLSRMNIEIRLLLEEFLEGLSEAEPAPAPATTPAPIEKAAG